MVFLPGNRPEFRFRRTTHLSLPPPMAPGCWDTGVPVARKAFHGTQISSEQYAADAFVENSCNYYAAYSTETMLYKAENLIFHITVVERPYQYWQPHLNYNQLASDIHNQVFHKFILTKRER